MESGYKVIKSKQMYKEGKHNGNNVVDRANPTASMASSGSFEGVFAEHPTKQKMSRSNAQLYSGDDETIDARAASYIAYVQERFRLQTVV
ncbi:hypothetical protein L484_010117 [Morus notabilis]|uniref:Uncharacterized protein n=1 Tax=Morus notabilis TaxID=981085 RepID=W9QJ39_9ROSA|nr:hypothetical protein L484_010117 [Morus notabilis]